MGCAFRLCTGKNAQREADSSDSMITARLKIFVMSQLLF